MFSSVKTASLVTHYQALSHESLISFMYYTALVASTKRFGPTFSGPKFHNLVAASVLSHSYFSLKNLALNFGSSFGVTLPFSISSARPSYMGTALA